MSNNAKRTRLTGAEYKKKRISRELDTSKQKDSILNFFPKVSTSTSQSNENNVNLSLENSEIESGNIDIRDNVHANEEIVKHVLVSNLVDDVTLTLKASTSQDKKDNFSVSSVNIKENIGFREDLSNMSKEMQILAPTVEEHVTLRDYSNCETVEQNYQDFSSVTEASADSFDLQLLKDPIMWPVICDKLRMLLVQSGPYQMHLKSYPKDDKGRRFTTNHFFRKLSNGIEIKRSWLVYSKTGDSVFCYCCKLFNESKSSLGKEGYHDWKNIAETLKQHERSPNHETSFLRWKELEIRLNNSKTIDNINQIIIKTEIQHWKQVIER